MSPAPTISIRPTDTDDVKWALQAATTQAERGSLAEAIQWVKRAAQHADESGDAWRAAELKNSAQLLAEQMWTAMSSPSYRGDSSTEPPVSVDVSIEDVDADDLLDDGGSTAPPRGRFESVPPGVVFRQSGPPDRPSSEPFLLSNPMQGDLQPIPYPLQGAPGVRNPAQPSPSGPPPSQPATGGAAILSGEPQFSTTAPQLADVGGLAPPPVSGATQPGFGPVGPVHPNGAVHVPFITKAPTLQFGSPQEAELAAGMRQPPPPRRKSIRPKPPPRKGGTSHPPPVPSHPGGAAAAPPSSSGTPHVFSSAPPTDRFSSAPGPRHSFPAVRPPMGSAPDLQVSELDLDAAGFGDGMVSMLPPPPSEGPMSQEPDLTPEEFDRAGERVTQMEFAETSGFDDEHVLSSARLSDFEVDPDLADLFAPEEVVEDFDSVDRMSDIVLDPSEFDNQSLIDDSEETHVLPARAVAALRSSPTGFSSPPSSGAPASRPRYDEPGTEHQLVSPSGLPTAPPPERTSAPPAFTRPPAVPERPHAPTSAAPFNPAPSSPESNLPESGAPGESQRGARSIPPILVRRGSAPASGPQSSRPFAAPSAAPRAPSAMPSGFKSDASSKPPTDPQASAATLTEPIVDGISLEESRGFEDLPAEVQLLLASQVRIEELNAGEEVSFFGAAIVTSGTVDILPAFSDESGAIAHQGDVVFTNGNLEESIDLRVAAKLDGTRVAVWDPDTLKAAIESCPWVEDELKLIADRYLAVCGATLGPLGERLDDALRATVFQRLEVRAFAEGEILAEANKPVPGLFIVGGGRVSIYDADGNVTEELSMGDFVFSSGLLGGGKAPGTAKASAGGALVLTASRQIAHELIMSVPPLVEVLAG